jgi:hypothetical protein
MIAMAMTPGQKDAHAVFRFDKVAETWPPSWGEGDLYPEASVKSTSRRPARLCTALGRSAMVNSRGPSSSARHLPWASCRRPLAGQDSRSPTTSASRRSRRRSLTARPPWASASRTDARPWGISGGRGNACHARDGRIFCSHFLSLALAVRHISIFTAAATKMRSTRGSSAACFSSSRWTLGPVLRHRTLVGRPDRDRADFSRSASVRDRLRGGSIQMSASSPIWWLA